MTSKKLREFYEQALKQQIPENWHVHHLDFDRTNNSILNLVAIPGELHSRYHLSVGCLKNWTVKTPVSDSRYETQHLKILAECVEMISAHVFERNKRMWLIDYQEDNASMEAMQS